MSEEEIESEIILYLNRVLENRSAHLDAETKLLETGLLDSVGILDLIEFIEKNFGTALDDTDMVPEHFEKVRAVAARVWRKISVT